MCWISLQVCPWTRRAWRQPKPAAHLSLLEQACEVSSRAHLRLTECGGSSNAINTDIDVHHHLQCLRTWERNTDRGCLRAWYWGKHLGLREKKQKYGWKNAPWETSASVLSTKCYYFNQITKGEIGNSCSTHDGNYTIGELRRPVHSYEDIIKWILQKQDVKGWTASSGFNAWRCT